MPTSTHIPAAESIGYPWFVHVADPGAGVSTAYLTLPDIEAEWSYYIHTVSFKLTTDANVANRIAGCRLFYHTGAPGTIWELGHTDVQAENLARTYIFAAGVPLVNMNGNAFKTASIPALPMDGNLRFAVKYNFGQVGDALSDIWFHLSLFTRNCQEVDFALP